MDSGFTSPSISEAAGTPPPPERKPVAISLPYTRMRFIVVRKVEDGGRLDVRYSITLRPMHRAHCSENAAIWGSREPAGHLVLHGIEPEIAARYRANQVVVLDILPNL